MKRVQISDNFYLDEFIPPDIYSERGEKAIALIDHRIVLAAQFLRETIGKPMIINNWWRGGKFTKRGLRRWNETTGARWSQHKYGRGFDFHISGMTPSQIHSIILQNEEMLINHQLITVLEDVRDTASWVHCDCRFTNSEKIVIVRA